MKQFIKPAFIGMVAMLAGLAQPAFANEKKPARTHETDNTTEPQFSIQLNAMANKEIIFATITNPAKKNLSVTLSAPDGSTIDNFFTGKKTLELNQKYNFTSAEEGVYTLSVCDGNQTIKKQIKLEHFTVQTVNRITVE